MNEEKSVQTHSKETFPPPKRRCFEAEAEDEEMKRAGVVDQAEAKNSFTEGEVEDLISEAQRAAADLQGSELDFGLGHSQPEAKTFQERIRAVMPASFAGSEGPITIGELGKIISDIILISDDVQRCRPQAKAGKLDLFPLPAVDITDGSPRRQFYLKAMAEALNSLTGLAASCMGRGTPTSVRAMKRLRDLVGDSDLLDETVPELDFASFFETRSVDYAGDEIKLARTLNWESISPSLPNEVGKLHLRDFCSGGVLHYIDRFEEFLVDEELRSIGKCPRVMCDAHEWDRLAGGLVDRGICEVVPESFLFHHQGKPLLNGMFAVSKQEMQGSVEICRLIINMKPVNSLTRPLSGDTGTLPTSTCLSSMFLDEDEMLTTSSEDIRCFFYLFQVPVAWRRYFGFGRPVSRGIGNVELGGETGYLVARVLPMGFVNSVAIAQHVHRNVVRQCMGSLSPPVGGECELRRDRVFSSSPVLFRVYLDNFDELRKVDKLTAALVEGSPSPEVVHLREAYLEQGLPRHPKKATEQRLGAEVQGAWIDGRKGVVYAKAPKVAKYVALALQLMRQGSATQRELQVVGGGLVYIAMFRRPLLCGLNQIWRSIVELEGKPAWYRAELRREVVHELARFLGLLPLAVMNLRSPADPKVTASDASTTGGGICVSRGLTPYGAAAALSQVRGDIPEEHDMVQILSVGLFDGISAFRVAMDSLGVPVAGHVSVEKSPEARRVVESYFPDTIFIEDVEMVTDDKVQELSLKFSNVGLVVLGAGPPCQGVSGLNAERRGALRDHRSCLFQHVPRIRAIFQRHFPWAQVHALIENVASMDYHDCQVMNEAYEEQPWFIDAAGVCLSRRPRLHWVTWELLETEGSQIWWGSNEVLPVKGEIVLTSQVDPAKYLEPGWQLAGEKLPTFTTSRPSPKAHRRPAGVKTCAAHELDRWRENEHRFPPYQYRDSNCLSNSTGEFRPPNVAEREAILGLVDFYSYLRREGLVLPKRRDAMDNLVSDYLEYLWSEGKGPRRFSLAQLVNRSPEALGQILDSCHVVSSSRFEGLQRIAATLSLEEKAAAQVWSLCQDFGRSASDFQAAG
eukprot:s267_g2.t1